MPALHRCSLSIAVALALTTAAFGQTPGWLLEFGPYAGYYDFDQVTQFRDQAIVGLRMGVLASPSWRVELEFDEVYTQREPTEDAARQISLALHTRYEPLRSRLSPSLLLGIAYVALDDSESADSFGEGYDVGLGLRWSTTRAWTLRAEWLLRLQPVLWHRADGSQDDLTLTGRAYRLGAVYAF